MVTFTQKAKDALKKKSSAITLRMENKNACYGWGPARQVPDLTPAVRRGAPLFKKSYRVTEMDGITVWYKPEVENFQKQIVVDWEPGFLKGLRIKERRL